MALGVKFMSRNMGFDLGTANIVVYVDGKGIVLREMCIRDRCSP